MAEIVLVRTEEKDVKHTTSTVTVSQERVDVYKDLHTFILLCSPGTSAELLVWLLSRMQTDGKVVVDTATIDAYNSILPSPITERSFYRTIKVLVNNKALVRVTRGEYHINPAVVYGRLNLQVPLPMPNFLEGVRNAGEPLVGEAKVYLKSERERDLDGIRFNSNPLDLKFGVDAVKDIMKKSVIDRAEPLQAQAVDLQLKANELIDLTKMKVHSDPASPFYLEDFQVRDKEVNQQLDELLTKEELTPDKFINFDAVMDNPKPIVEPTPQRAVEEKKQDQPKLNLNGGSKFKF